MEPGADLSVVFQDDEPAWILQHRPLSLRTLVRNEARHLFSRQRRAGVDAGTPLVNEGADLRIRENFRPHADARDIGEANFV